MLVQFFFCRNSPPQFFFFVFFFTVSHVIFAIYSQRKKLFVNFQNSFENQHENQLPTPGNYQRGRHGEGKRDWKKEQEKKNRWNFYFITDSLRCVYWYAWSVFSHSHYRDKVSFLKTVRYLYCYGLCYQTAIPHLPSFSLSQTVFHSTFHGTHKC